jgi:hypothetical protein
VTRRYPSIAALRANISPDVRIIDDPIAATLAEMRAVLSEGAALLSQDADADANERNAGSLGAAELPAPTEHDEQCALFSWAAANEAAHPELCMLFAIPNGAKLPYTRDGRGRTFSPQRVALVQEGLRAGVPDCFLAVARGVVGGKIFHGLFIEMKRKPNKPTLEQLGWIERLRKYGYSVVICHSAQEAINAIMAYLAQDGGQP